MFYEILRSSYTVSWHKSLHTLHNGNAQIRNSIGRAHVPHFGDLLQEGIVAKIADDLYCGGDTPAELPENWQRVLQALERSDIGISASKTVVAPRSTTVLGWVWSQGSIHASPHPVATLSTCEPPSTVKGLRSFIGAYKVLARVVPRCAHLIPRLDDAVAGCNHRIISYGLTKSSLRSRKPKGRFQVSNQ